MKKYNYSSYKANVALKIFQKIVQQQPEQQPGVVQGCTTRTESELVVSHTNDDTTQHISVNREN